VITVANNCAGAPQIVQSFAAFLKRSATLQPAGTHPEFERTNLLNGFGGGSVLALLGEFSCK
jgi:hypothetical protein